MTTETNAAGGAHELVRQRDQLRAWIAKLDEVGTGANSRVAERVRADYQERLSRVTEALSAHGEEIQQALDAVRAELAQAEEAHAHAGDALEETRLRHMIGELDEPAWDEARRPLEEQVANAEQAVTRARGEVERLTTLAQEITGAGVEEEMSPDAADDDQDVGGPIAFLDEEPAAAPVAAADEVEPALDLGDAAGEPHDAAPPELSVGLPDDEPVSGEELAAWISEVESEVDGADDEEPAAPAAPAAEDATAEAWDPFANEFGGAPASPATQPGDAGQDLPWLDQVDAGPGKWSSTGGGDDDLAFLDHLDRETAAPAEAPGEASGAGDLADDDLAFLEELDRAISGGSGARGSAPPAEPAPIAASSGLDAALPPDAGTAAQRKRGEALLCKECGAINEPQAWYCEICGSEL